MERAIANRGGNRPQLSILSAIFVIAVPASGAPAEIKLPDLYGYSIVADWTATEVGSAVRESLKHAGAAAHEYTASKHAVDSVYISGQGRIFHKRDFIDDKGNKYQRLNVGDESTNEASFSPKTGIRIVDVPGDSQLHNYHQTSFVRVTEITIERLGSSPSCSVKVRLIPNSGETEYIYYYWNSRTVISSFIMTQGSCKISHENVFAQ